MIEYLSLDWLPNQNGNSQVLIYGGYDVEPGDYPNYGWREPSVIKNWLKGYATIDSSHRFRNRKLYALAANGCHPDYPDPATANENNITAAPCTEVTLKDGGKYMWNQEDIYKLTWASPIINQYPDIFPIPQIYGQPYGNYPNGPHAREWYKIALYSYLKHSHTQIDFPGILTQQGACKYNEAKKNYECTNNTPHLDNAMEDAINYLRNELSSDSRTYAGSLVWRTDIDYYEGQP